MEINDTNRLAVQEFIKELYQVEEVNEEQCKALFTVISDLNDREEVVLTMINGFKDGQKQSLYDVAKHFGVTREKIRQIEHDARVKLKHPVRVKKVLGNN